MFREIANCLGDEYPTSDEERDDDDDDCAEEWEEEEEGECEADDGGIGGEECQEEEAMECDEVIDPGAPPVLPTKSPKPVADLCKPRDDSRKLTPKEQHDLIRPNSTASSSGMQAKRNLLWEKLEKIKALQDELGVGSYGCSS